MENFPTWMPVVAGAFVDERGRWMMHQRPLHKHHGGLWEFPGGKVERGESPLEALVREVKEELTVDIRGSDCEPLGFAQSAEDAVNPAIVMLLYRIERWSGTVQAEEGGAINWYAFTRLNNLSMPPLDRQLLAGLSKGLSLRHHRILQADW